MARFLIGTQEYYPFCTLEDMNEPFYQKLANERPDECIDLTEEEYTDYKRVMKEFYLWQEKLGGSGEE